MKTTLLNLALMAFLGLAPTLATATSGKALYIHKSCHTCHGAEGKSPITPMYPKLNGQNATYLLNQMKDIKSGKRSNGLSMVMRPQLTKVSEAEMHAIAEYLATVK